ncbi:MAG: hypothetical protein AAGB31_14935 [Bdellovibrio sp.]
MNKWMCHPLITTVLLSGVIAGCSIDARIDKMYLESNDGAGHVLGASGKDNFLIPSGYYDGTTMCVAKDDNLIASNIRQGVSLFGRTGSLSHNFISSLMSMAYRNPGVSGDPHYMIANLSPAISLQNEISDYGRRDLSSVEDISYRDIPDQTVDSDGLDGIHCRYAPRPSVNCGDASSGLTTVSARIADCAAKNPQASMWDGTTECNGGEGVWRLVSRSGANKEVWRDERTQLLWSSVYDFVSWCDANGAHNEPTPLYIQYAYNTTLGQPIKGNGKIVAVGDWMTSLRTTAVVTFADATTPTVSSTIGYCAAGAPISSGSLVSNNLTITAGSTASWVNNDSNNTGSYAPCAFDIVQGSIPFEAGDTIQFTSAPYSYYCGPLALGGYIQTSLCAETAVGPTDGGENWATGVYSSFKGGMGQNSSPSVFWRAPSPHDMRLAYVNGMSFVMPDAGAVGTARPVRDGTAGGDGEWVSHRVYDGGHGRYGLLWWTNTAQWDRESTTVNGLFGNGVKARCVGRTDDN